MLTPLGQEILITYSSLGGVGQCLAHMSPLGITMVGYIPSSQIKNIILLFICIVSGVCINVFQLIHNQAIRGVLLLYILNDLNYMHWKIGVFYSI